MKALIIAVTLVLSSVAFAQDGYHSFEEVTCDIGENCLISKKYDHVLKLIAVEDEVGEVVGARLSSNSFLADTVYRGADVCFKGDSTGVCKVLEISANADGGDGIINTFKCEAAASIKLTYEVEYYGYGAETLKFEIKKCE